MWRDALSAGKALSVKNFSSLSGPQISDRPFPRRPAVFLPIQPVQEQPVTEYILKYFLRFLPHRDTGEVGDPKLLTGQNSIRERYIVGGLKCTSQIKKA